MTRHLLRLGALMVCVAVCALRPVAANPIDSEVTAPGSPVESSEEAGAVQPSTTAGPTEGSKMSRFLDDVTSAFKQGTAKMKESLESAASSVKDGVLQGYDYVRSKLTGVAPADDDPLADPSPSSTAAALTEAAPTSSSTTTTTAGASPSTERPATSGASGNSVAYGAGAGAGAVGVSHEPAQIVPNDDDDDERIIFNDKDYTAEKGGPEDERDVTEAPAATGVTIDNRFIIASPLACKSGQEVVNGKCRNVF